MLVTKKVNIFSNIRVFATLLVLLGHCTSLSYGTLNHVENFFEGMFPIPEQVFKIIYNFIYSFHMPLFVTLSGALFDRSNRTAKFSHFCVKKIKRLVIPYLTVAIFLFIPIRLIIGYYNGQSILKILLFDVILGADINYLWYLVMLIEVSIVFWIIREKLNFIYEKQQILLISIFIFLNIIALRSGNLYFQIHKSMEFMIWFYIGVLINKNINKLSNVSSVKVYCLGMLQIFLFLLNYYLCNVITSEMSYIVFYLLKILLEINRICLAFIGIFFVWLLFSRINHDLNRYELFIENSSFEIYLYHVPLITLFSWFVQNKLSEMITNGTVYSLFVLIKFLVAFFGSLLLIIVLRMVERGIRKYVKR